jgi:hypothetical protein
MYVWMYMCIYLIAVMLRVKVKVRARVIYVIAGSLRWQTLQLNGQFIIIYTYTTVNYM